MLSKAVKLFIEKAGRSESMRIVKPYLHEWNKGGVLA